MYPLKRLDIENFKCYERFSTDLSGMTILAGENAAGKSSVIQSILLHNYASTNKKSRINTFDVWGNNLGTATEIHSQFAETEETSILLYISGEEYLTKFSPEKDDVTLLNVKQEREVPDLYKLYYLNAERISPKLANAISFEGEKFVGVHGQNTVFVMNQMDFSANNKGKIPEGLRSSKIDRFSANCQEWLQMIVPGIELSVQSFPDRGVATIRYKNSGDTYYSPTATGFGITYVLPIIVQALIASMEDNSVLIVENPEAHLHPYSQSMIGKFLAYVSIYGTQVILETHSEHVVNGCRLQLAKSEHTDIAKILFFSRGETGFSHESIDLNRNGELSHWPKGFFDQNQQDLKELLKIKLCKR